MIQTRAVHRLKANMTNFGQATLPGSTSSHDQSDITANAEDTSGADLTGENNTPGGDFSVPTEASANNPVIAPPKEFKPSNPNPDSVATASRALERMRASTRRA